MLALRGEKPQCEFFVVRILCFTVLLGFLAPAPGAFAQEQTGGSNQVASPPQEHVRSGPMTSLADLLAEAQQNNPQIRAVRKVGRR